MPKAPAGLTGLISERPTIAAGLRANDFSLTRTLGNQSRMRNLLDMVRQIRDFNADASQAISNILRLANSGWDITVADRNGKPDEEGRQMVDALVQRVATEYGGGIDVLIDQIHLTVATQGAIGMEIELTQDLSDVADFVTVNPWVVDFQRDPAGRWIPGIQHLGVFTPLHPLQFRYIPLDPEPDDPRGRSPFWAALDVVFFQMEVLRDLKAATHFAGYPRIDISVAWEAVLKVIQETRPDMLEPGRAEDLRAWLDEYLGDITEAINDLKPDDAFVHYDSVTSTYVVPRGSTINIAELIKTIDTQIVSGLKQLPILLGRNEGATTTHATVQWQVYVRELAAFQRVSANLLGWALTFALRVWGRQSVATLEYSPLRTSERQSDAQAMLIESQAYALQTQSGWISDDEAAQAVAGHDAVGDPQAPAADAGNQAGRILPTATRAAVEDIRNLPWRQQERYRAVETAAWQTYRAQIRQAWSKLDELIRDEEQPGRATVPDKR